MRSCGGSVVTSSPKKRTVPDVGGKSPVTQLSNVVLPAPFDPSTARRSPGRTLSVMSVKAASAPKSRLTPRNSIALPVPAAAIRSAIELTGALLPPMARARANHRRQRPMTPSGENKTMTRKPRPIRVWKRRPSSPTATSASSAKVRRIT